MRRCRHLLLFASFLPPRRARKPPRPSQAACDPARIGARELADCLRTASDKSERELATALDAALKSIDAKPKMLASQKARWKRFLNDSEAQWTSWRDAECQDLAPLETGMAAKGGDPRLACIIDENTRRAADLKARYPEAAIIARAYRPRPSRAAVVQRASRAQARAALEAAGWQVSQTDLYASGFDPCERPEHYRDRADRRGSMRRESSATRATPTRCRLSWRRIAPPRRGGFLLLQYPMWWHMPPAILKGWFDRVFVYGGGLHGAPTLRNGAVRGKRALLSVTVGTSAATYEHNGRSGDISLMLWPVEFTLAYVGYEILAPFVAYGVEGALRYSDPAEIDARFAGIVEALRSDLRQIDERPMVPFNRMSDWGADGRIKPDAPVYSPYIRHRRDLDLG